MVWSHDWSRPIGRGTIEVLPDRAVFQGRFFTTAAGAEAYEAVKQMGDLQEYSYGYAPVQAEPGEVDGQPVRVLKALKVFEVSPVLVGAGVGTGTDRIKQIDLGEPVDPEEKPFPNEHACRLRDPGDFQADSFRRIAATHDGKEFALIIGRLKGQTSTTAQAARFPRDRFTAGSARAWCSAHDGSFEAAKSADPALHAALQEQNARFRRTTARYGGA